MPRLNFLASPSIPIIREAPAAFAPSATYQNGDDLPLSSHGGEMTMREEGYRIQGGKCSTKVQVYIDLGDLDLEFSSKFKNFVALTVNH
ncbi:hypothetical protein Ccrd_009243 [Cynara cardunculus var. scolymus]|uniref:Uncharacterized protein n=1 Tax=Cynara cardunculus var. scolymus TaxID=59895 RepID=A0A103YNL5_CYNCS|nr:hypothetical protein Ccrd_009243 [Cynara cardunculus var. scolymus]